MLKELWILIKLLFTSPDKVEDVCLMNMKHFPFKGYKYLMWCGKMIYRDDMYDRRQKEWATDLYLIDKNHETTHLMQAKLCGSWRRYYRKYLWQWIKGNPITHPSSSAYYTIPYEMEAYANEDNLEYCKTYDGSNLPKYYLTNRKSLYKKAGGTSKDWKEYIKTL